MEDVGGRIAGVAIMKMATLTEVLRSRVWCRGDRHSGHGRVVVGPPSAFRSGAIKALATEVLQD